MNFKLKGRTLLNADIIQPEIPYAEFSEELFLEYCQEMVETLNYGHEMLMLYKTYNNMPNLDSAVEMIKKMDIIFNKWNYKIMEIRRNR